MSPFPMRPFNTEVRSGKRVGRKIQRRDKLAPTPVSGAEEDPAPPGRNPVCHGCEWEALCHEPGRPEENRGASLPADRKQDRRPATGGNTEKLGSCNAKGFAVGLGVRNCPADRRQAGGSSPHRRAKYGLRIGGGSACSRWDYPPIEQNDPESYCPDKRSGKSGPRESCSPCSSRFERRIRRARSSVQSHGAGPQRESEAPRRAGADAQRAGNVPQDSGRTASPADRSAPGLSKSKVFPFPPRR